MSSIAEEDGSFDPIKVLIVVQDEFDLCDMAGPMEVFSWAQHDRKNKGKRPAHEPIIKTSLWATADAALLTQTQKPSALL
jgi:hypothetical protein